MSKKYNYNKSDIAAIVEEFKALLVEHDCADDVCVYYNNRRTHYVTHLWNKETKKFDDVKAWVDEGEGFHPTKYCKYAPETNIISFSSEGTLYDYMYSDPPEWLEKFALKYGMYIEYATSWFFYFAPCNEWTDFETDNTPEHKQEPITLFHPKDYDNNKIPAIKAIAQIWEDLCRMSEDKGGCAIGYGMIFKYEGQEYKMIPRSNKQGEWSWEQWVDKIKNYLSIVGCTDIVWHCGRLD